MAFRNLSTKEVIAEHGAHFNVLMNEQRLEWEDLSTINGKRDEQVLTREDLEDALQERLDGKLAELREDKTYAGLLKLWDKVKRFVDGPLPIAHLKGLRFTIDRERARDVYLPNIQKRIDHYHRSVDALKESIERGPTMIPTDIEVTVPEIGDTIYRVHTTYANEIRITKHTITKVSVSYYHFDQEDDIHVYCELDGKRGQGISWEGIIEGTEIVPKSKSIGVRNFLTREAAVESLEHYLNNLEARISELREEINS